MSNKQAFFKAVGQGMERAIVPDLRSKILAILGVTGTGGAGIYGYHKGFGTGKAEGFSEGKKETLDKVRKNIADVLLGVKPIKGGGIAKKAGWADKLISFFSRAGRAAKGGAKASQAGRSMRNVTPARARIEAPGGSPMKQTAREIETFIPESEAAALSAAAKNKGFNQGLVAAGLLGTGVAGGTYALGRHQGYDKGYHKGGNESLQAGLNFGHYLAQQQLARNNDSFINRLGNLFSGNLSNLSVPDFSGLTFEDMLKMQQAQQ